MYRRASKKQLSYIASLSDRLGVNNPTLYSKYSLTQAERLIKKLLRQIEKRREPRQQRLF